MGAIECVKEVEILEAVISGCWPDRCDAELHDHVAGCAICTDVVVVAGLLHADRARMRRDAAIPAAYVVWWRAQMRARAEAAAAAARPITLVQAIATVSAVAVVAALARVVFRWFEWRSIERVLLQIPLGSLAARASKLIGWPDGSDGSFSSVSTIVAEPNALVGLGVAASLLLVSIALYFVLVDE